MSMTLKYMYEFFFCSSPSSVPKIYLKCFFFQFVCFVSLVVVVFVASDAAEIEFDESY